jgi:hypothetical protein
VVHVAAGGKYGLTVYEPALSLTRYGVKKLIPPIGIPKKVVIRELFAPALARKSWLGRWLHFNDGLYAYLLYVA